MEHSEYENIKQLLENVKMKPFELFIVERYGMCVHASSAQLVATAKLLKDFVKNYE